MRRTSNLFSWFLAIIVLLAGACSSSPRQPSPHAPDFWAQLSVDQEYTYFDTLREMWQINEVAIIGRISKVKQGRTLGGERGEAGTVDTALLEVDVREVVRGELSKDSEKKVDVEIITSSDAPLANLEEIIPDQDVLFLLQDVAKQPQPKKFDDTGVERDPNKKLYTIPTPKALFVERDGDVVTPLDPAPGPYEDSIEATTLPELADEIRSL